MMQIGIAKLDVDFPPAKYFDFSCSPFKLIVNYPEIGLFNDVACLDQSSPN